MVLQDRRVSFTKAQVIYQLMAQEKAAAWTALPNLCFALTIRTLPPFQESLSWLFSTELEVLQALNACLYFQTSVLIKC